MADEQFDPGGDNSVVVGHGGPASTATTDNTGAPLDPGGSRYPDMMPGPPKTILGSSFHQLPSDTRGGMPWDNWQPPSFSGVAGRVGTEMSDAYQNTPPLLSAEARDELGRWGWPGKIARFAGDVGSTAAADFSALGAGALAGISELGAGGDPQKARDIHAALTIAPVLAAGAPRFAGPNLGAREPATGGDPLQARTIATPEDALKFYNPQIKAAEQSDFRLSPKFTDDWLASLEDHTTTSPAGKAVNPEAPPVAKLIDDLRNAASAPLDNIKSIQEVDQRIQRAISEQSGSGGDPNQVRQIRGILQDFRDRYGNVPSDQYTGSPQGVAAFQDSLKSYAAVSRLREVQGLIDGTEGNPNRSTLLASRVNAFLNDDRNTKGWNDAERKSLRDAANSGFVQEWMRAQGSRLVGIGSAVLGGGTGMAAGVPLQVGVSYLLRNAMEDMRLKKVRDAMGVLGQRVPQPGTVPPAPVPRVPSQGAVTAARYAPLAGLLGQTINQPRDDRLLQPGPMGQ